MNEKRKPHTAICPICSSSRTRETFRIPGASVARCTDCGFQFLHPQPTDQVLHRIYSETYFLGATDEKMHAQVVSLKTATANLYLDLIANNDFRSGHLLEIGCGDGYLLAAAEHRGYEVTGIEYSEHAVKRAQSRLTHGNVLAGELLNVELQPGTFDVCVLADVIEHIRDPRSFLTKIRECLKPGGALMIATPSTDSWSACLMRKRWMEYKTEHMSYFNRSTLKSLLQQTGFRQVLCSPGGKIVSLHYVKSHFEAYPVPFWTPLVRLAIGSLPRRLQEKALRISGSGMVVLAAKAAS